MSPILFFINCFTCTGVGKIFLQINSAAVAFINILIAAWEGLTVTTIANEIMVLFYINSHLPNGLNLMLYLFNEDS